MQGRVGGFDHGFAWARSDRPEVRWYDGTGTLLQVARWEDDAAPLDAAWRGRFLRDMGERMGLGAGAGPAMAARRTEMEERLNLHDGPLPWWGECPCRSQCHDVRVDVRCSVPLWSPLIPPYEALIEELEVLRDIQRSLAEGKGVAHEEVARELRELVRARIGK